MADLIEPTQRSFQNAETTASDVLTQASPNLLTKTGSVIRELIIRPVAHLMSWLDDNYQNTLEKSSVAYLKTSQETVNPTADLVASNYFVTRLTGTSARGILTLTLTQPVLRIGKGSPFTVGCTHVTAISIMPKGSSGQPLKAGKSEWEVTWMPLSK